MPAKRSSYPLSTLPGQYQVQPAPPGFSSVAKKAFLAREATNPRFLQPMKALAPTLMVSGVPMNSPWRLEQFWKAFLPIFTTLSSSVTHFRSRSPAKA